MSLRLFKRNLAKHGKTITLEDRTTSTINGLPVETFSNPVTPTALVKTVTGVTVFDNTNTERVVTHEICLLFLAGITSEKWVKLGTTRIKVLTVENCCENDECLKLMCTERGLESKVVNDA
ncbi:MAG: hypothetical protein KAJ19_19745 [Gammaproteobacteria bacterium]|nr:hypothetical protein [Gammaproteobacteria bacterium]